MENMNLNKEMQEVLATVPNLGYRSEALATEDMGMYLEKIGGFFTRKIDDIKSAFGSNTERLDNVSKKDMTEHVKTILKLQKDFISIKEKVGFTKVLHVETPVMLGQKVSMLEIITNIKPLINDIDKNLLKDIDDVDTVVSKMIADVEHRKSIKITNKFKDIGKRDSEILSVMDSIIDKNGTKDRLPMKNVISNISSIETVLSELKELNGIFTYNKVIKVKESIKKLYEKTDTLHELLNESEDFGTTSKAAINELAYGLENIAKYITESITVFYVLNQTTDNVKAMIKLLQRFE